MCIRQARLEPLAWSTSSHERTVNEVHEGDVSHCAKWHGAANHPAKEVRDSWHQCPIVPPRRELRRVGRGRA